MSHRTPGKTPSRGKRGETKHVPYNADPKKVGTFTNAPMPTDVQRTADGFEDPEAFFFSPGTVAGNGDQTFASAFQTPNTARGGYDTQTPMTGVSSVGQLRRQRSRLSDLDQDEDERDDLAADDLLDDEDVLHSAPRGSQRYFENSNPPAVSFPARSRLPPDSPSASISLDALPSPSRTPRGMVNRSPRKSTLGAGGSSPTTRSSQRRITSLGSRVTADVTADMSDDALASQSILEASPAKSGRAATTASPSQTKQSPRNARKSKVHATSTVLQQELDIEVDQGSVGFGDETGADISADFAGDMTMEAYDDDDGQLQADSSEHARRKSRLSTTSRRSNATRNGDALDKESVNDNDNGPSMDFEAGDDAEPELGDGYDTTVGDVTMGGDQDAGDFSALADDDDAAMEEQAVAEQEQSGEEDQDSAQESQPAKRGRKPKIAPKTVKTKKGTAQARENSRATAPRGERAGSVAAKPKKTRISQIGVYHTDSDEEDGYHGNFTTRRSKRHHFKPLEYWRNEKFEYARGPGLPVIKEVITFPEETVVPFAVARKARGRSRTHRSASAAPAKRQKGDENVNRFEGWDELTDTAGVVIQWPHGEEGHRKIACPKALLEPKATNGGAFYYQKVFGEGSFMASGVVHIPPNSQKASKPSKDNAYVFYVIQGAVQVTLHRTSFIMAPGGQFLVPRGNNYSIENVSDDGTEVRLFFAQCRKLRANEEDNEGVPPPSANGSAVVKNPASRGSLPPTKTKKRTA
ncbi:hypothetical protein IAU60_000673 [Kwoniella sp. DSM 27419]